MKNHLKLGLLALAAALVLASCAGSGAGSQGDASQGDTSQGDTKEQQEESGGMAGMDHESTGHGSGDVASGMLMQDGKYSDERFIDAMVPHHQGAVEMARVALKNAEHDEIVQLSENVISSQQAEIEELKSIKQEEFGTSRVPMEMSQEQLRGTGMTMDPQQLANRDPFDKAFIDAMIPHHQSAIEMARVASEKSKNPQIKELAGNIISAQQAEIEQMKQWRKEWYPHGHSDHS
jgi:uncharacterized protein (DUF305 family)